MAENTEGGSLSTITFPTIEISSKIKSVEFEVVYLHHNPLYLEKVWSVSVAPASKIKLNPPKLSASTNQLPARSLVTLILASGFTPYAPYSPVASKVELFPSCLYNFILSTDPLSPILM